MIAADTQPLSARFRLLDAALKRIRAQGYRATSVEDLCRDAGVTKGAFFHHFHCKDDLAIAAANHWSETTSGLFAAAAYHQPSKPLDRVLAYIDFRTDMLQGKPEDFTCLVGTMVQEIHATHPAIRAACAASILDHAATLEADIDAAIQEREINADWTAQSLARHTQAVLQGAFILAKATDDASIAVESARHLRRYVELLFQPDLKTSGVTL